MTTHTHTHTHTVLYIYHKLRMRQMTLWNRTNAFSGKDRVSLPLY